MALGKKVERATWEGPTWGRLELAADWNEIILPPLRLPEGLKGRLLLTRESSFEFAKRSGYAVNGEWISFVANIEDPEEKIYLAGEFSGWGKAIGQKTWEMTPQKMEGRNYAVLTVRSGLIGEKRIFKFVTDKGNWREPSFEAPNVAIHEGARNLCIDPAKTGGHAFRFEVEGKVDWRNLGHLVWNEPGSEETISLWPGEGLYNMSSASPQGAIIDGNKTRFRVFAPRATAVSVYYCRESGMKETCLSMTAEADGCWSALIPENLEGYNYYYTIQGPEWPHTNFEVYRHICDPWALAVRDGCGVVIDKAKLRQLAPPAWKTPPPEDLVIVEAHIRDLAARAPLNLSSRERMGFSGVQKLLEWDENSFALMGVNAVELQPLMEFDGDGEAYHWGYMSTNFFAPASAYSSDKRTLKQLTELPSMVHAFHDKGIAVIVDVVFNHMGVPASPLFIDKAYYFRTNSDGTLVNCSGCGNDFKVESVMAEKMVLEALEHWVLNYGVDGFRFDLAELLGVDFLKKAQDRLKAIKPDIILIAEPWSFRGHMGGRLRSTEYASWNDGFREFVPAYLAGSANAEGLKLFISGSVGGIASRPVHSLNYVESHDDYCWMDRITQNPGHNGYYPTLRDRRWTHLMVGLVAMSLGVPMFSAGQECLRSKYGVGNTYLRGDLNAIDYARYKEFPSTVQYFKGFIALRRGANGKALRVRELEKDYLRFFGTDKSSALAILYNAEKEEAAKRLLYAINPTSNAVRIHVGELEPKKWRQIADHERISEEGLPFGRFEWKDGFIEIPPASCGVWVEA
jgi:pullulanase/glycogen debranching enzyme